MSNLAISKNVFKIQDALKQKPILKPKEDVKVVIAAQPKAAAVSIAQKTKLSTDMDNGQKAKDALELLRQRKILGVSEKFPEKKFEFMEPKAPVIEIKKPIIRKLTGKTVGLEEEPEAQMLEGEMRPVVGEQGLEMIPEKAAAEEQIEIVAKPRRKREPAKRIDRNVIPLGPEAMVLIGDTPMPKRLPPPPEYSLVEPQYYMNNRETFINFINGIFDGYREDMLDESKNISCEDIGKDNGEIGLLTHQKIVRDYINLNTPYRGLLLYHGLGSGKTCSSIAIAEGIKSGGKQVIVMTPASLQRNYIEEIKKCGDLIYRKNQFWEWISIVEHPEYTNALASVLGFKTTDYITRKQGAWLTNVTKPNNYSELSTTDKKSLNDQLDEMIRQKYRFINYNGLRRNSFRELTNNFENNIFNNSIVVIDEAHNLISRIVNKINKNKRFGKGDKRDINTLAAEPLAIQIYDYLMRADNCRVVLLTGTPIINYPNEIAVLFNILRGYIKTWHLPLNIQTGAKINKETLQDMLSKDRNMDYIDYSPSSKMLIITRNPLGFKNKKTNYGKDGYQGVTTVVDERGIVSDAVFLKDIESILNTNNININKTGVTFQVNTALPDTFDEFVNIFIDKNNGNVINIEKFKKRIIGLTSYFRSAQEELLPKYDKNFDKHVIRIPMSDYQFKKYEEYRHEERKSEGKPKKSVVDADGTFKEPSSTYRIFSRLACNFVMPVPPGRPIPKNFIKNIPEEEKAKAQAKAEAEKTKTQTQVQAKVEAEVKAEPKLDAKALKEQEKRQKLLEKEQKLLEKEAVRALKEKQKEEAKLAKEEEKRQKELAKAEAKEEEKRLKAQAKEEEKRRKAEEKALKKKTKVGGGPDDSDSDSDSYSDTDSDTDSESDSDKEDNTDSDTDSESDINNDEGRGGDDDIEELVLPGNPDEPVALQGYKDVDANLRDADEIEGDEFLEAMGDTDYKTAIIQAYDYLKKYKSQYLVEDKLETYSPKFLAMLNNIDSPEYRGLHLVYSQFRSMEGIGIFSLVLEANGFAQFKIRKTGIDSWELNMSEEEMGKPTFALYTGTEDAEEREIIRNIYNGMWDNIPNNIAAQLRRKSSNNNLGEIIKVLMITSAGSEGINLRNTRYVHIMEPYWHPVRVEQVIGRARRICSHKDLPEELQTVEVFIYIMEFTKAQLDSELAIELRIKPQDKSKLVPYPVQTSDQKLYEISTIKEQLSTQLLTGIKEASIDCATYTKSNTKEGLVCLSFGKPNASDFAYNPNYAQDENDTVAAINRVTIDWEARPFTVSGKQYMLRMDTNQVYDYDSVIQALKTPGVLPILIGKLVKTRDGNYEIIKDKM